MCVKIPELSNKNKKNSTPAEYNKIWDHVSFKRVYTNLTNKPFQLRLFGGDE